MSLSVKVQFLIVDETISLAKTTSTPPPIDRAKEKAIFLMSIPDRAFPTTPLALFESAKTPTSKCVIVPF